MSRISKTTVGTISVTALRDGERTLPFEALKNLSDEDSDNIKNDDDCAHNNHKRNNNDNRFRKISKHYY